MYDLNAKINYQFSKNDRLFLSFYNGQDIFPTREKFPTGEENRFTLGWGNTTLSLRYTKRWNDVLFMNVLGNINQFNYQINLQTDNPNTNINQEFINQSNLKDIGGKLQFDWNQSNWQQLKFGGEWQSHQFNPGIVEQFRNDHLLSRTQQKVTANSFALFVNDELTLGKKLKINAGLRWTGYLVDNKQYQFLEPRLTFNLDLNNQISTEIISVYQSIYRFDYHSNIWQPPQLIS